MENMTFEVKSGAIYASDPCYNYDPSWLGYLAKPAANGTWKAELEISDEGVWGKRVKTLSACHSGTHDKVTHWEEVQNLPVDSGQMSICDNAYFLAHESERSWGEGGFYADCCNATTDEKGRKQGGIIGNAGVCSSSGFGDGGYNCFVSKNDEGEIVAIKIEFIPDEEDEEDFEELEEENA